MVAITKVLKRKDAASVVVAVVLAMIISPALSILTHDVASQLSGSESFAGGGWQSTYVYPIINAVLQIILLEVFILIYVAVQKAVGKK